MNFWFREIGGWALVLLGVYGFFICTAMLLDESRHQIFEAGPMAFLSVMFFRGGIHLLKVAVAARICLQAHRSLEAAP